MCFTAVERGNSVNVMTAVLRVGPSKNRGQGVVFGVAGSPLNVGTMIMCGGNPDSEAAPKVQKRHCISGFRLAP